MSNRDNLDNLDDAGDLGEGPDAPLAEALRRYAQMLDGKRYPGSAWQQAQARASQARSVPRPAPARRAFFYAGAAAACVLLGIFLLRLCTQAQKPSAGQPHALGHSAIAPPAQNSDGNSLADANRSANWGQYCIASSEGWQPIDLGEVSLSASGGFSLETASFSLNASSLAWNESGFSYAAVGFNMSVRSSQE